MLSEIAKLIDVNENELTEFTRLDEFNNNIVQGYLCRRSDHRYGMLIITKVNCWETQQLIYATPKLHYPFDKNGTYRWPDCKRIQFFEKLDGTNILAYHYKYEDKLCLTFKTRLTPFLQDQVFGMFKSMWNEYVFSNSWVYQVILDNIKYNLSFELFGSRNPITIMYSEPLCVKLLFGVNKETGDVVSPSFLTNTQFLKPKEFIGKGTSDLTKVYNSYREEMSIQNKDSLTTEGMVMYAQVEGESSYRMFKVKPEEIEKIHWTASGSIPRISLFNTAMNVFESSENPILEDFLKLLREEYPENLITKSMHKIEKIWKQALDHAEFTTQVNEIWIQAKQNGLDITKDKNETMRFMSKFFNKQVIQKVAGVILKQAGMFKEKKMQQHGRK